MGDASSQLNLSPLTNTDARVDEHPLVVPAALMSAQDTNRIEWEQKVPGMWRRVSDECTHRESALTVPQRTSKRRKPTTWP